MYQSPLAVLKLLFPNTIAKEAALQCSLQFFCIAFTIIISATEFNRWIGTFLNILLTVPSGRMARCGLLLDY